MWRGDYSSSERRVGSTLELILHDRGAVVAWSGPIHTDVVCGDVAQGRGCGRVWQGRYTRSYPRSS